jgi:hypothetical protein
MSKLSRRKLGSFVISLGGSFLARCQFAVAQTAPTNMNLKVGVSLEDMSAAVEARLRNRIAKMLIDERYVRDANSLITSTPDQSGPSTDPDYSEFWVQMVPKGTSASPAAFQNADWSEEQWNEIKPSWDEMTPSSSMSNSILTINFKNGRNPNDATFYQSLLEIIHQNAQK